MTTSFRKELIEIKQRQLRKLIKKDLQTILNAVQNLENQPGTYKMVYEPHVIDLADHHQVIQAIYVIFNIDRATEYPYSLYLKQHQFEIEYTTFNHVTDEQIMTLDQIGDLFEHRSWQIGKSLQITAKGSVTHGFNRKSSGPDRPTDQKLNTTS